MDTQHRTGCLICASDIIYSSNSAEKKCIYCGNQFSSNVSCKNGHFVCDSCHSSSAFDLIENTCLKSDIQDPIDLAVLLMKNPQLKMHGPEHHFLVPAVLYTSLQNQVKIDDERAPAIAKIRKRAEQVKGGFCGTHGSCGAAMGAGIFCSVITGATPLSTGPWRLSNKMTARCLNSVAENGGPRCCKRDTFLSILESVKFLEEEMDIQLDVNKSVKCDFSDMNKECLREECDFYIN